jgi:2-desacetyl-2-hydroxyethyl bacteriochlorophyllide A dehydrogenase
LCAVPYSVRLSGPQTITLVEEQELLLQPHEVRVHTLYSGISAGTELTAYRGSNPYLNKTWDPRRRLFQPGGSTVSYPVDDCGYEEVGEIVEVGSAVTLLRPGQIVWGSWGHRGSVTQAEDDAQTRLFPEDADPVLGIFSHIGAVALNAMLDADLHVGETVAVFGLGVPGQLTAQLARLNGAQVIAVDVIPDRLAKAAELGAAHTIDAGRGGVAEQIMELTGGRGTDASLEVSGSYLALQEAIRATAYGSRVVACGFFQHDAVGLALGEEFHHNRIQLVCSQISGVAPGLSHRWTRHRLRRTVIELAVDGRLQLHPLISHVLPVGEAAAAFRLLDQTPEQALQVVLKF